MDMENRRFDGEKNLSDKLEQFDGGYDLMNLIEFESKLEKSPRKTLLWVVFKNLGLFLLIGGALVFLFRQGSIDAATDNARLGEAQMTNGSKQIVNGSKQVTNESIRRQKDEVVKIEEADSSELLDKQDAEVNQSKKQPIRNTRKMNSGIDKDAEKNMGEDNIVNVDKEKRNGAFNSGIINKNVIDGQYFDFNNKVEIQIDKDSANESTFKGGSNQSEKTKNTLLFFASLSAQSSILKIDKRELKPLFVTPTPIEVVPKKAKRISFGIQYNTGKTHAGEHETPFVSSFPTRIEGGKSFGYGFFGQVYLNERNMIRPSFSYSKNTHLHFVDSLRFQTGFTGINMELYSHELKFGLDYAFDLFPGIGFMNVKAGAGIAYHQVISLESNNYYNEISEEIRNLNELDLAPFSYKLFMALEVPIYRDIVFGLEPYIIYQERLARYTPSTFLADQGQHNYISGLNMTLRF